MWQFFSLLFTFLVVKKSDSTVHYGNVRFKLYFDYCSISESAENLSCNGTKVDWIG